MPEKMRRKYWYLGGKEGNRRQLCLGNHTNLSGFSNQNESVLKFLSHYPRPVLFSQKLSLVKKRREGHILLFSGITFCREG